MAAIRPVPIGINAKLAEQGGMLSGVPIPQKYPFPLVGAAYEQRADVFLGAAPLSVLALPPAAQKALARFGIDLVCEFAEASWLATGLAAAGVDQTLALDLVEAQRQLRAIARPVPN